ncbi:MAG: long-chain fatty acid--CoA ligase [Actinomycetota bacterium]|nr:long-chain fatty acid--CoA ligase [Actinomycetota bacterium]MDD5668013.1 long-chain fatty acid--CoA ligase [Actinomycetota bacterium]
MEERIWHKSYTEGVPWSIDYDELTVSGGLARSAKEFPNQVALNYMGRKITYSELDDLVNRFARALMDLGIKEGDKVATILPNIPQMIIANMAAFRIGAVVVLNNPLYTERELQYQLNDSDSVIAITLSVLVPRIEKIMPETKVEKVIGCQVNTFLGFPKKQLFPLVRKEMYRKLEPTDKVLRFEDLIKKYPADPVEEKGEWNELSTIIYTGGTTGVSKGVMLSHKNISVNVQQFAAWFPDLERGGISLIGTFPVFHAAGFTACQNFFCWQAWEHIMIPRPDSKAMLELIKKYKPDFLPGVPTIFVGLLAEPEFRELDLSFIKGFFSGAAPLAADTIRDLKELTGATIQEIYGQTETTPVATITPWKGKMKPGTVGIPVSDTDIKIVDLDTGEKELPQGEVGEIAIYGPQNMMGYYKKPEETAQALRDGWVYTGDIGYLDEDGYLSVVDRKKDMVIAGGYNIYPVEIDDVLFEHPKILEACAVGVPDKYRGETLKAFIVIKEGEKLTEEEVIAYCRETLAPYKVPKNIEFVAELPKSVVGKILRRELRDREIKKSEG